MRVSVSDSGNRRDRSPQTITRRLRNLVLGILVLLSGAASTRAQTFTVDTVIDAADASPGDGICATAAGECTLRAAIEEGNMLGGVQAILLPAGAYVLSEGPLGISGDLSIGGDGPGLSIIDGNGRSRVMTLADSADATISGVTIQHGFATGVGAAAGILNLGTLRLSDSTVRANAADCGDAGGILNSGGTLTLTNTTVRDNFSCNGGAGILNAGGTLIVTTSTVSSNGSILAVGGIANIGGVATLTNTTVSGNRCTTISSGWDYIGGILNRNGLLTLNNATVTDNLCVYGMGGLVNEEAGTVTIGNTIVARNPASADCQGLLVSVGYNLDGDTSCGLNGPGDLTGMDPLLGPLQDNGGPTFTHALLPGSPVIDTGNPAPPGSGDGACEASDQRGVQRPQGAACDMGAYEREP